MPSSASITEITSSTHFQTIVSSNTYVVADFYADWCGPCKAIAPLFAQLAAAEAKPGKMAFVKVNVDSQQAVARTYGVSAMPTFLILKNGTVSSTIRGADPSALRAAITTAARTAASSPATSSAAFSSTGRTLGGSSSGSSAKTSPLANVNLSNVALDASAQLRNILVGLARLADRVGLGVPARFVGLYLWTLFSLDTVKAAETSPFAVGKAEGHRAR